MQDQSKKMLLATVKSIAGKTKTIFFIDLLLVVKKQSLNSSKRRNSELPWKEKLPSLIIYNVVNCCQTRALYLKRPKARH